MRGNQRHLVALPRIGKNDRLSWMSGNAEPDRKCQLERYFEPVRGRRSYLRWNLGAAFYCGIVQAASQNTPEKVTGTNSSYRTCRKRARGNQAPAARGTGRADR